MISRNFAKSPRIVQDYRFILYPNFSDWMNNNIHHVHEHQQVSFNGSLHILPAEDQVSFSLTGSNSTTEGNILVEYQGTSGYICDDNWNITAADVLCKQFGHRRAIEAYYGSAFDDGGNANTTTTEYFMDNVNCQGDEPNLLYCEHGGFLVSDCGPEQAAGVLCEPIGEIIE